MTCVLCDSRKFDQARRRKRYLEVMRGEADKRFDDLAGRWKTALVCLPDEASKINQSLHRHRLVTFSNFRNTHGMVKSGAPNLVEMLQAAVPGSMVLVLRASGGANRNVGVGASEERVRGPLTLRSRSLAGTLATVGRRLSLPHGGRTKTSRGAFHFAWA